MICITNEILCNDKGMNMNKSKLKVIKFEIEILRNELENQILTNNSLLNSEVYETSLRLDSLIEDYIKVCN